MASLCFSAPTAAIVAHKPLPSNFNQLICFSRPLAFNPLRCSPISTPPRFSSIVSMASSSDRTNEPPWKSLGKSIENFVKKPSVEDLLKQQIEKQEYYDEDGGDENPPGGKGGGGGGDAFGGSEEEGFLGETIQVILATLGLIVIYDYILNGAGRIFLAKDYLAFLFGGRKSTRLTRAMYIWEKFWKHLTAKKVVDRDRFWLEKAIINTPTWWDSPEKYMLLLKSLSPVQPTSDASPVQPTTNASPVQPRSDANEDMRDGYDSQGSGEMGDEFY